MISSDGPGQGCYVSNLTIYLVLISLNSHRELHQKTVRKLVTKSVVKIRSGLAMDKGKATKSQHGYPSISEIMILKAGSSPLTSKNKLPTEGSKLILTPT